MKKRYAIFLWFVSAVLAAAILLLVVFRQPDISVGELKRLYAQEPSQFMNIQGMLVHYRDEGVPADTVPLVLVHGTSSSLFTWDACTKDWIRQRRVIRMDLPGFGLTGPHPDHDYSIGMYVDFLENFLRQKNIDHCYLAGNSLGGLIAFQYAARFPQQVMKVILIDPAGYPTGNAKGSLAFKLGKIPVIRNILTIITPLSVVRKSLEDAYGNDALVSDALVKQYRDMACREGNRKALLERLKTDQEGDTSWVQKLMQPTLILWGDQDRLIPVANAHKFQRDLPNDTMVVFPGVGHVPMEERPELVIPIVIQFLE